MILQRATVTDFESVLAFYEDVIERTPHIDIYARWSKGKHPTAAGIHAFIEEGSLYLFRVDDVIRGAIVITMYQGEDYHAIKWAQDVADDEVAVIHMLAVSPDLQGQGIGAEMVKAAVRLAQEKGKKAIRLDALASNTPGHRLYERLGFEFRGKQHLYAENTGWTDFYFFEYRGLRKVVL
jgi:ribosomal protein S18 acetylase RimI-like enzyme